MSDRRQARCTRVQYPKRMTRNRPARRLAPRFPEFAFDCVPRPQPPKLNREAKAIEDTRNPPVGLRNSPMCDNFTLAGSRSPSPVAGRPASLKLLVSELLE